MPLSEYGLNLDIDSDAYRYCGAKSRLRALREPGFRFTVAMRLCAYYKRRGLMHLPAFAAARLLYSHYRLHYGFDVPFVASIGAGLFLGHVGGVVVSGDATIGRCVNISQGVTIGRIARGRKMGAPVIGDRVWIGANAVVVGGCVIGSDARIAPGAFLDFSVPECAVVVGNPARVVSVGRENLSINNVPPWLFSRQA